MAQIPNLQSTNTLGLDDQVILRQGTIDKRISLNLAGILSWARRWGYNHIGEHGVGSQFSTAEDFTTYQGFTYFVKRGVTLPYTSGVGDPSADNNLYRGGPSQYVKPDLQYFSVAGDGVTNDTASFTELEEFFTNEFVDLEGKTYLVDAIPSGNRYSNGNFKVGSAITPQYGIAYEGKVELSGLQPERLSEKLLRIFPGYCSDGASVPTDIIISNSYLTIDMTTNGLNGLDTGTPTIGQDYFVYMLKNPTTGVVGAVISAEISTSSVTKPSGYTLIRKLPFGFIWVGANGPVPAGIPAFHLTGWPSPMVTYTNMDDGNAWEVLQDGTSPTLTTVDCSSLVPDNARQVLFHCEVNSVAGGSGSARLRSSGSGGSGKPVGHVVADGKSYGEFTMKVTSARAISYLSETGTSLTLRVAGYCMTERS